jgi:hypothetical protein
MGEHLREVLVPQGFVVSARPLPSHALGRGLRGSGSAPQSKAERDGAPVEQRSLPRFGRLVACEQENEILRRPTGRFAREILRRMYPLVQDLAADKVPSR